MKKKRLLTLGILAVLVLAALIYTRPMTLQQIGKVDIAQCESISGYHLRCPEVEDTYFELSADDERFSQLAGLFARQKFRRSLLSSTGSGTFLQCRSFFGVLRIFNAVEDETLRCTVSGQDEFLQQVYDIVSLEP